MQVRFEMMTDQVLPRDKNVAVHKEISTQVNEFLSSVFENEAVQRRTRGAPVETHKGKSLNKPHQLLPLLVIKRLYC
jgi:hypothetical protein